MLLLHGWIDVWSDLIVRRLLILVLRCSQLCSPLLQLLPLLIQLLLMRIQILLLKEQLLSHSKYIVHALLVSGCFIHRLLDLQPSLFARDGLMFLGHSMPLLLAALLMMFTCRFMVLKRIRPLLMWRPLTTACRR